jgi:alpha-1,2-mannosyltransferase
MHSDSRALRMLAGVSIALLIYEGWTLATSVLLPLLGNPNILQTDFHYYYDAALRFRADSSRLYQLSDDVIAGFTYPPPAILPFVLLSYLPLGAAFAVLTAASYAAVLASIVMWLRYLRQRRVTVDRSDAIAATLVALALGPTYSNAIFGQVNAWVLVCAVAFITIGPLRPAVGGALLAAGTLLKIYPGLLTAVGLWDRRAWRPIAYSAIASIAIVVLVLPIVPPGAYQTFVNDVLPARVDKTAVHISNQSLIAFIERLFLPPERFLEWTGEQAVTASAPVRAFNLAFGLAIIALLSHRARRGDALHAVAGLIALAAVIAPLGWGHTYVLSLPLVILHLIAMRHGSPIYVTTVCVCVAAMMIPAGRRFAFVEVLPAIVQNIVYSRYLLATVTLLVPLNNAIRGSRP